MTKTRTAVVLFNLGGPDNPSSVKPFLFNLFFDPAIFPLPRPLRWFAAKLISSRREKEAAEIYEQLGGSSPLLENTQAQARALEKELGEGHKVFIVMRYWHPRAAEVVKEVRDYQPDRIVALPLYPQFSTTTSGSSLKEWKEALQGEGLGGVPLLVPCCYPTAPGFIASYAEPLIKALDQAKGRVRVLFSAHGLPESIINKGDPYQWQVEQTAAAIAAEVEKKHPRFDWVVTYQSRVGPQKWIEPYTDAEIEKAGQGGLGLVVVPLAFVSDHSETLVELDVEYRELAEKKGVPEYHRVPVSGAHPAFIKTLADLVRTSESFKRVCPSKYKECCCG